MKERIVEKLSILADAAKYDVSCASSGSKRKREKGGLGNSDGVGICHSYTEDGRCISLLKILFTNHCIYDCAYCTTRRSNDVKRAAFTVDEVVDLTVNFYRRNYIEGLFLSSGIFKSPDDTMERLVLVAKKLRTEENFHGYIHLKAIPGASEELLREAGLYADRLSVNVEMPTAISLETMAPDKSAEEIAENMGEVRDAIDEYRDTKKTIRSTPLFAPGGQSTQMIVGATPESDYEVITRASSLYDTYGLRRVYYSGYIPIREDNALPPIGTPPPVQREHRLYQSDWLMRFYGFEATEIITPEDPNLDLQVDPKLGWALRHMESFPVDLNSAPYEMILRVPGIGVKSARKIISARRFGSIRWENLRKFRVALNRARYFITCLDSRPHLFGADPQELRRDILAGRRSQRFGHAAQTDLFAPTDEADLPLIGQKREDSGGRQLLGTTGGYHAAA